MNAAELRHVVTIQSATETRDSAGGIVKTWATVDTVRAKVSSLSGREFFSAQQVNSEISAKILLRHRPGVTSKMRVVHGSKTFEIVSPPIEDEKKAEMTLLCKAVNP